MTLAHWIYEEYCAQDFGEIRGTLAGLVHRASLGIDYIWAKETFAVDLANRIKVHNIFSERKGKILNALILSGLEKESLNVWNICIENLPRHIELYDKHVSDLKKELDGESNLELKNRDFNTSIQVSSILPPKDVASMGVVTHGD